MFQDNYQSVLELIAGVQRVVQTELELGRIQRWTLREATAVYGQDVWFSWSSSQVPDVRLLHDARGTDVNPYMQVRDRDETPPADGHQEDHQGSRAGGFAVPWTCR